MTTSARRHKATGKKKKEKKDTTTATNTATAATTTTTRKLPHVVQPPLGDTSKRVLQVDGKVHTAVPHALTPHSTVWGLRVFGTAEVVCNCSVLGG